MRRQAASGHPVRPAVTGGSGSGSSGSAELRAHLVPVCELGADRRAQMFHLLRRHFAGISWRRFESDLDAKNWALLIRRDEDGLGEAGVGEGTLVGFTSLFYERLLVEGETLGVVSSGDTIVDPAAWGSSALSRSWIEAVRSIHAMAGPVGVKAAASSPRLYWLLLTSGFRTYRMLPLYWREFYPRHDRATPESARRLLAHLARRRYGSLFDPACGRVIFPEPQILRPHLEGIPERRRRNPHIAFFERVNPGHAAGDELVCLTEITPQNLTRAGRRMVRAGAERGLVVEARAGGVSPATPVPASRAK